jgi:succinyl-CoA synthetase beta subunit
MKVLNKLIYRNNYTIKANSIDKIFIPSSPPFDEYIINKDANVQYIIYLTYSHGNFNIQNIKRAILINQAILPRGGFSNTYFYSLINFDFIKEDYSILLKDIKEKMYRIYYQNNATILNPNEFLVMEIQNTDALNELSIYLELRELNAIPL